MMHKFLLKSSGFLLFEVLLASFISSWFLYSVINVLSANILKLYIQYSKTIALIQVASLRSSLQIMPLGSALLSSQIISSWQQNWPHVLNLGRGTASCYTARLPCSIDIHWKHLQQHSYHLVIG